jgi:hypothetical protein
MRLWILSLIASITCMVAPGYAENPFSDEIWEVLNYRRKLDLGDWLLLKWLFQSTMLFFLPTVIKK